MIVSPHIWNSPRFCALYIVVRKEVEREVFLTEGSEVPLGLGKFRKAQDTVLLAEGFEPAGEDLWIRDGIYYGREAALQKAHSRLLQRAVQAAYDEPGETPLGKAF